MVEDVAGRWSPEKLDQGAVISDDGRYRYFLRRVVDPDGLELAEDLGNSTGARYVNFIMLNPSTADASEDDPTIRRCIGFARRWKCHVMYVTNLFAFRATSPADLRACDHPLGEHNGEWLVKVASSTVYPGGNASGLIIPAWGSHGTYRDAAVHTIELLRNVCRPGVLQSMRTLGTTKGGQPRHPLYLPADAKVQHFSPNWNAERIEAGWNSRARSRRLR